jgi:Lon protease-like protein
MAVEIPIFPLSVVLFPHMPMPLHIFEERYRQMMRDCEERRTGFGVVAIREGQEVGAAADPHRVGTLAQLRHVDRFDDGRYNILVVGAIRYRIERLLTPRPYPRAEVRYLEDSAGDAERCASLALEVSAAFRRYAATLRELAGETPVELDLPIDPELLGYLVAATLRIESRHKQRLLEMDSAEDRLEECIVLLRREAVLLDQRLAQRELPVVPVSSN